MRSSLVKELLEHLVLCGGRLFISGLFLPRGVSMGASIKQLERIIVSCTHDFSRRSHNTISTTLNRMKQQGLVARDGVKKNTIWCITKKGRKRFGSFNLELPKDDGQKRLVVFDIPEKERRKRGWLRVQLRVYGFKPLQKSVWLGTRPFSVKFLKEANDLGISDYIHIFCLNGKVGVI